MERSYKKYINKTIVLINKSKLVINKEGKEMDVTELRNARVMDRSVYYVEELPEGYECKDITDQFTPDKEKGMYGLKFVGKGHPGGVHTHASIMKALKEGREGFMILAIDRVYKELLYVCL